VQVNRRAGLGFAAALRATLRQDPDVIMVGELRDRRTVQTAMAAALTGHLVLSTLHTNDAPSAAARLVEMGAPPYLVAATLIGVLAQRLARRLCPHCRVDVETDPGELLALGLPPHATTTHVPRGCSRCDGTGYHGRIGIYELMPITLEVRERLLRRGSADALREAARATGVRSLRRTPGSRCGRGGRRSRRYGRCCACWATRRPLPPLRHRPPRLRRLPRVRLCAARTLAACARRGPGRHCAECGKALQRPDAAPDACSN
jgi:type II secretory ATPase GspE/PulE/Tfp pilus assembly ATPase PilB-like protein